MGHVRSSLNFLGFFLYFSWVRSCMFVWELVHPVRSSDSDPWPVDQLCFGHRKTCDPTMCVQTYIGLLVSAWPIHRCEKSAKTAVQTGENSKETFIQNSGKVKPDQQHACLYIVYLSYARLTPVFYRVFTWSSKHRAASSTFYGN